MVTTGNHADMHAATLTNTLILEIHGGALVLITAHHLEIITAAIPYSYQCVCVTGSL